MTWLWGALVMSALSFSASAGERCTIETSLGTMTFELWADVAPKTVANFKKLASESFFDGTAFHRVIRGRVIYGGDPLSKDSQQEAKWGTGGPGYTIEGELNDRKHDFGVISMAHDGNANEAGSRFLICLAPSPYLNKRYTAFGRLISGDDVLRKIGNVPVKAVASGERSRPTKRVEVKQLRVSNE